MFILNLKIAGKHKQWHGPSAVKITLKFAVWGQDYMLLWHHSTNRVKIFLMPIKADNAFYDWGIQFN